MENKSHKHENVFLMRKAMEDYFGARPSGSIG